MMLATIEARLQIKTPLDAAQPFMFDMGLVEQEEVRTMLLDTRYRVIATPDIYKSSIRLKFGNASKPRSNEYRT